MKSVVRAGAAGIALAAVMLSNPAPASASGTLQHVGGAGCGSAGNNTYRCFDEFNGGTAPYTATGSTSNGWASVDRIAISDLGTGFEVAVYGRCTYNKAVSMTLNVRDSSGQVVTLTRNVPCRPISDI